MNLVFSFKETTSTMDISHRLAQKGYPRGTVIIAETQTSGRGRLGRKWLSPLEGLWFSIILYPNEDLLKNLGFLGILISTSVCFALEKFLKIKLSFKWPNDIELEGKKIAGILFENVYEGNLKYIICGIGINLLINPSDFSYLNINASSLRDYLYLKNKRVIFLEILKVVSKNLERFPQNWKEIFSFYKSKFPYIGKVMVNKITRNKVRIIDLAEDGSIFIEEDGIIKKYNWGGISLETEGISY